VVRVGGRIEVIEGPRLTLHDGTGRGTVRLGAATEAMDPQLRVGEVVNATGRVRRRTTGTPEVVVESASDIERAAGLGGWPPAPDIPEQTSSFPGGASMPAGEGGASLPLATDRDAQPAEPVALLGIGGLAGTSIALLASAGLMAWRSRRVPLPPSSG
jgi:hypothetical protein